MKISYGITVCDEHEELNHLLYGMHPLIENNDEIVILRDISNTNSKVTKIIESHKEIYKNQLIVVEARLNNDFATFKNQLLTWATGDYLFQIDADEIPNEILVRNLKSILECLAINLFSVSIFPSKSMPIISFTNCLKTILF
jgi:glycosyltransferase involved in cell wall biosynthesis